MARGDAPLRPRWLRMLADLRVAALLTGLVALAVVWGTLSPPGDLPPVPGGDKLHHFLGFGALAFPLAFARPRLVLWVIAGAAVFGGAIELIQPAVGRTRDFGDAVANTLGALGGAGLAVGLRWLAGRRAGRAVAQGQGDRGTRRR